MRPFYNIFLNLNFRLILLKPHINLTQIRNKKDNIRHVSTKKIFLTIALYFFKLPMILFIKNIILKLYVRRISNAQIYNHSYETPQLIAYDIVDGYKGYLDWIGEKQNNEIICN